MIKKFHKENHHEVRTSCKEYLFLHPEKTFLTYFDGYMLIAITYSCFTAAFFLAFEVDIKCFAFFYHMEILTTISFALDLFLNFFRIFVNKDGEWIRNHMEIAKKYFWSGYLIIDIIATFPFYLFELKSANTKILRLTRLTRITRIFSEQRFVKIGDALSHNQSRSARVHMR